MFLTFHMVRYNVWKTLKSFRFEDGNDYEYEICLKVFFCLFLNNRYPGKLHCTFDSQQKLSLLKEVKPSPDSKMIKLLIADNYFPPLRHSR